MPKKRMNLNEISNLIMLTIYNRLWTRELLVVDIFVIRYLKVIRLQLLSVKVLKLILKYPGSKSPFSKDLG